MSEIKNEPKLRFPGFTGAWEQRKFGEVVQRESISAISGAGLPCVEYEDIITEDGILNKDIFSKTAEKKGILFEGTEVLYGKLRPYLHNWLKPQFKGVAVGDWWVLQSDILQQNFLYRLIQTKQFDEIANQSAGSKMPRADWGLVSNAMFNIPSNQEEQEKIGAFFEYLDNIITLHQNKLEVLKKYKTAMLHRMFPRDGAVVPEIRFPEFTGDWEQRKVQDIYKITRGYVLAAPETSESESEETPYPVYSSQTKNNGLMGYYKDYLYENAITWTTDGANAGTVNYRAGKFYCTNVCGVLLSDEGYSNKCAAEALNSVAWKWVSHVGNPKLMNNVMGEIPITLPKSIEEQNKISEFFVRIDTLITLHQQKVDLLKQYKAGLLQQMFV